MREFTRREFISSASAGAVWLALDKPNLFEDDYGPFKMGIQSYSLRTFSAADALDITRSLGLKYWEAYQDHVAANTDPAALKPTQTMLRNKGITLFSWGVQGFDGDEAKSRKYFEFAKLMNIKVLSADPTPEALDHLEKLVKEFDIAIAIHNHGPGARYDKLNSVVSATKNRDRRMGACVDTGHALRSGEDPVEWVRALGDRVHDIHLKDVKDGTKWAILGQGDLNAVGLFIELRKLKFRNVVNLEYEANERAPVEDIKRCLEAASKAIRASA